MIERILSAGFLLLKPIPRPEWLSKDLAHTVGTSEFEKAFGWPGVFYTLDAALAARSRFFPDGDLVVIALGLPVRYRDAYVSQATPPAPDPGFAPRGTAGYLDVIERNGAIPQSDPGIAVATTTTP